MTSVIKKFGTPKGRGNVMAKPGTGIGKNAGVPFRCPKCTELINITDINGDAPVRCEKCNYPMIRRSDLLVIVAACKNIKNASQTKSATDILRKLSDHLPEAGTALGTLASKFTLPMSEDERWSILLSAYAGGDEHAKEWLHLMCKSNPGNYAETRCKNCGAIKYISKYHAGKMACIFCHNTD